MKPDGPGPGRWLPYCLILGLYFTLRGYHSLDGDQAYRLPLLLHRLDPTLYASDPFVRAFDAFNPHRGSLLVLEQMQRWLGLPCGLACLFVATFLATCRGFDRLARAARAGTIDSPWAGPVTIVLVLAAKAGNIGTNHLFEAMVLDRLMALAFGWLALAAVVADPRHGWHRAALWIGAATVIHPSLGMQLGLLVACSYVVWALPGLSAEVRWTHALPATLAVIIAWLPGLALNLNSGASLLEGLPPSDFWTLAVELQGPQHMLPHLWRIPQWLAWASYFVLAAPALRYWSPGRLRLVVMLAVTLAGLGVSWLAIELLHEPRVTVFQPFRMATVARGLALVLVAGRLVELWRRGDWLARARCSLIAVGLAGDWTLAVVTVIETAATLVEALRASRRLVVAAWAVTSVCGLAFLARHDTQSGHRQLGIALGAGLAVSLVLQARPRLACACRLPLHWMMPLAWGVPASLWWQTSFPPIIPCRRARCAAR